MRAALLRTALLRATLLCTGLCACWGRPVESQTTPTLLPPRLVGGSPSNTSRGPYADVSGEWRGIGTQYDDNTQWQTVITLDPDGAIGQQIGTVEYPALGCGGVLIRQPELGDGTLVLHEAITHNPVGRCIDGGSWRVPPRPDKERLDWKWFAPNDGKEEAAATLERTR